MDDVVIIDCVRTPIGRRNGGLSTVHPVDLSAIVLRALEQRTGLNPADVDDVIWGCVTQTGEQAVNIARNAVLAAGWPFEVPATTVDRQCGSSQQAIHFAAAGISGNHYDVAVAGGVESMSRVPMVCTVDQGPGHPFTQTIEDRLQHGFPNQGESAEMIADRWDLTRTDLDTIAVRSHANAARAATSGRFEAEIVPVSTGDSTVTRDEGIRPDTSLERLAGLRTVFRDDGRITAGNSSPVSDGAAAVLLASAAAAERLGLAPIARFKGFALAGVDPIEMLTGPIPATEKVLRRAGLSVSDVDVFEVNEAFASVTGAWLKSTGADPDRLNVNGGAIALGHPLGATGARLLTTMVHHMRASSARVGLQAICEGGGLANAMIVEMVD